MNITNRTLNLLKKIIRTINLLKSKQIFIKFKNPEKKRVLIIDHYSEESIKECLLKDIKYEVLDTRLYGNLALDFHKRSSRIFISPKIIYYIFYYFFIKRTNSLYNSYIYSYIRIVSPKVVLDQTKYGFLLEGAKLMPDVNFVFIVDAIFKILTDKPGFNSKVLGYSLIEFLNKEPTKHYKNLYISLIGNKDKEHLIDLGLNEKQLNIIISGSYKAQYIKKKIGYNYKKKFDITFISQVESEYLENKYKDPDQIFFYQFQIEQVTIILEHLSHYIKKRNLSCLIQLRDQYQNEVEENFIRSFFTEKQKIFFQKRENAYSAYYSVLNSELVISNHSNLSYEAMFLGRKSLIMPLEMSKLYKNSPNKFKTDLSLWDWTIVDKSYEAFENKVDQLLNMEKKEYLNKNTNQMNYIVDLNFNINEDSKLKKTILDLIQA